MTQENNITNNIDLDQAHKMAKGLAVRFGCLPEFKAHEYEEFLQLKDIKKVTYHNSLIKLMEQHFFILLSTGKVSYDEVQPLYKMNQLPEEIIAVFSRMAKEKGIDISPATFSLEKKTAPKQNQEEIIASLVSKFDIS